MKSRTLERFESVCNHYGINAIYVFGSRSKEVADFVKGKGNMDKDCNSDVDLGVLPDRDSLLTPQDRIKATIALEDLLKVNRVDLIILPEAPPFLCLDIIEGELLYTSDPDETSRYELYVLRRAGDLAFYERQRRIQILTGEIP
ncbi:MAG: nucleotidyltransferase domain-containing protein [bacterium]